MKAGKEGPLYKNFGIGKAFKGNKKKEGKTREQIEWEQKVSDDYDQLVNPK